MGLFDRTSETWRRTRSADPAPGTPASAGAPGSRDARAQAVHRLQVGLFGLAAMLLLVSLASVIMQRVATADRGLVSAEPSAMAREAPAKDPLVDLGVAPDVPVAGATHKPAANPPHP